MIVTEEEAKTKRCGGPEGCGGEHWRAISGFDGVFEVSCSGRVRSLPRLVPRSGAAVWVHGCELRGKIQDGYRRVCLSHGGEQILRFVHVLVAEVFLPARPSPLHTVNHRNGKRAENRASNLEWATPSEQSIHSWRVLGRVRTQAMADSVPQGQFNGRAKITDAQTIELRARRAQGETTIALARAYGLHPSQISRIASGKSRGYCGYAVR
jgi:NUMOD4 motif/HNH endonuclease